MLQLTLICSFGTLISMGWTIEIKWTKYEYEDTSDGLSCAPSKYLFFRDDVLDLFECSTICFLHNTCATAEFIQEKLQCIGCTAFSFNAMPWSGNSILLSRRDYHIDCKEVLENNEHAVSGVYEVRLNSLETIDVYCDMTTDGGGWTIFQRRFDDSVDFNRTFADYESGFGDINGEFWLGLHYIQELTFVPSMMRVRTSLPVFSILLGADFIYVYESFNLVGANYEVIAVDNTTLPRAPFYTYDQDTKEGCAALQGGGWWFHDCDTINLNHKHDEKLAARGIFVESTLMVRRP